MNKRKLNKIKINTLALNRWGGGVKDASAKWEKVEVSGLTYIGIDDIAANGIISLVVKGWGSQAGTPTPTAPQKIICNRGNISYGVTGKNLLEVIEDNIVVGKYINNNGIVTESLPNCYFQRFVSVKASTAYTLSTSRSLNYANFMEYDSNGAFLKRTLYGSSSTPAGESVTHTMGATTAFVIVGSNINATEFPNLTKANVMSIDWMFNEGTKALTFEPYSAGFSYSGTDDVDVLQTGREITFNMPPMLAVNSAIDSVDVAKNTLTRRVGLKVFDGSEESWYLSMSGDVYRYRLRFEDEDNIEYKSGRNTNMLCTHFKVLASGSTANGCFLNGSSNVQYLFLIPSQTITDLESFRQWLQMQYAKGTPVMIAYQLAEAVEEAQTWVNPIPITEGSARVERDNYIGTHLMDVIYKKIKRAAGGLITFKIIDYLTDEAKEYKAEAGMTWDDFCQSEYNVDYFYSTSEGIELGYTGNSWNGTYYYVDGVMGGDVIEAGNTYTYRSQGSNMGGGF